MGQRATISGRSRGPTGRGRHAASRPASPTSTDVTLGAVAQILIVRQHRPAGDPARSGHGHGGHGPAERRSRRRRHGRIWDRPATLDGRDRDRPLDRAPDPVPILALTALAQAGDAEAILRSGCCDAYMAKPASLDEIRRKVEELLETERRAA